MAVQATESVRVKITETVVKGRRNGGSSNCHFDLPFVVCGCERPPKWRFKQLDLVCLDAHLGCERPPKWRFKQPMLVAERSDLRCERPPKWRFKQLKEAMKFAYGSCERPPKWRFKQPMHTDAIVVAYVVKGRRNGGSSNSCNAIFRTEIRL